MKRIRYFVALAGVLLLLLVLLLLTTCHGDETPDESAGSNSSEATDAVTSEADGTEPDTEPSTDTELEQTEAKTEAATPHQTEPDPETEGETVPPVLLTAEEARALLSAALGKESLQAAVSLRTERNGDTCSQKFFVQKGDDFCVELRGDGVTEGITVVGNRAYYLLLKPSEFPPVEKRFVTSLTDREREALYGRYMDHDGLPVMDDGELIQGILSGDLGGVRYGDGTVELTCTGLDGRLGERLFGIALEGAELRFEFMLDKEVRVTLLRGTVSYPVGGTEGSYATVSTEMTVNYTPSVIGLPADATDYAPTTYDEIFGVQPPEVDPEAAAAAGMPLDREHYTLIGGNYLYDPTEQYGFMTQYPHCYAGKTFTLYGIVTKDGSGQPVLSLGSGMEFPVSFDGVASPVEGSYVKITATYRKIVDEGIDHRCYAMKVSSCEVLGEARGPNGGKLLYVTSAGLNVRSSSDTSSSDNVIGTYSKGDLVEVFERDENGWYRVVYNGQNGYVNGKYLSETKP